LIRNPHLQDEALYDCYYAVRRGEALDPPSAEHLADCAECSSKYAELGTFLTGLSEDADAELAALFPPERLHAQQQEIARKLTLIGRAARVITFPGRAAAAIAAPPRTMSRLAPRWLAAAAAAGLLVGVAASTMFNFRPWTQLARDGRRPGVTTTARQSIASAPSRLAPAVEKAVVDMDDMFMSDLESVLDRPHTSELVAFDALTPHVREVRDLVR
jgi:hypothetical protein